jgi:hypothetical protein
MDMGRFFTRESLDRYRSLASVWTNHTTRLRLLKILQSDTAVHLKSDMENNLKRQVIRMKVRG